MAASDRCRPAASRSPPGQQRQRVTQAVQQLSHAQRLDPRRRQLNRQRHPVQPRHQPRHRRTALLVHREPRIGPPGPVGEQRHRLRPLGPLIRARHSQRPQPVPRLPRHSQRLPAGRQDLQIIGGRQQPPAQLRSPLDHMLAIIQHQQQLQPGQHPGQRLRRRHTRLPPHPQRRRHHRRHQHRITDRRQLHQPHPVREPPRHLLSHLTGQPGLPHPARPGHRHQPALTQQARHLAHRPGPPDKTRQHSRETMHATTPSRPLRPALSRPDRVQPGGGQPEQPHRPIQALQPVLAHIHQREPELLLFLILDDILCRLRDQHLPAPGRGADPRRAMHRHAGVPVPGQDRLAGMHADPHPDPGAGRPPVRGQRTLHVQRAQHRLRRAAERDEEPIPLHVHLMTAMRGDGRADQPPVLGQDLRIPVPQRLDQPRRALDVAEQERDQPTREPAHPPPPPPAVSRPRQQARLVQAPGSAIGPPRLLLPPSLGPQHRGHQGRNRPATSAHHRTANPYPTRNRPLPPAVR